MSKFVIPFESHSPFTDITMFYAGSDSSSKDTNATSPSLMYPHLVLPKAWVPPGVDMVDLVWEDEGENRGRTGGGHVYEEKMSDVALCGACRPWIFFINGVLLFLRFNGRGMEKEER